MGCEVRGISWHRISFASFMVLFGLKASLYRAILKTATFRLAGAPLGSLAGWASLSRQGIFLRMKKRERPALASLPPPKPPRNWRTRAD